MMAFVMVVVLVVMAEDFKVETVCGEWKPPTQI